MSYTLNESKYNSPNYTPSSAVAATYGMPRQIKGVTIHHWGVDGQNIDGISSFLCRPGGDTSAHFALQDGLVYCLVSPEDAAWHAGSAEGNATTIGIECRPEMTDGDLRTLVEFIRWLETKYGSLNIYPHQYWFGTACPGRYAGKIDWIVEQVNKGGAVQVPSTGGSGGLSFPVDAQITQNFGDNATAYNLGGGHTGTDYAVSTGTTVKACGDGTVLWADWADNLPTSSWDSRWYLTSPNMGGTSGGIVVVIQHAGFISVSAHLNSTGLNTGDHVSRGQEIGKSGATGTATGPHLHFEIIPTPTGFDGGAWPYGRVNAVTYINNHKATAATTAATTSKDWFDMATEKDLEYAVNKIIHANEGFFRGLYNDESRTALKNYFHERAFTASKDALNSPVDYQGMVNGKPLTGKTTVFKEIQWLAANFGAVLSVLNAIAKDVKELKDKK